MHVPKPATYTEDVCRMQIKTHLMCIVYWPQLLHCLVILRNQSMLLKALCSWARCLAQLPVRDSGYGRYKWSLH